MAMAEILDNPFEGWTTIEEAAEIVDRDKKTVRTWADKGLIASYRVGRKMRVVNIEEVKTIAENSLVYKKRDKLTISQK